MEPNCPSPYRPISPDDELPQSAAPAVAEHRYSVGEIVDNVISITLMVSAIMAGGIVVQAD
jgi:hypothetical protein